MDGTKRQALAAEDPSPTRRCIVTRESGPASALLRFVVGPDGAVVPDVAGSLPGRGIWLTARRGAVETAVEKRLFARAARRPVVVDPQLADRVEGQLLRRCVDLIGLARRGGGAVAGYEKVRAVLSKGTAGLLLAAVDGAADGREKLERLGRGVPVVSALTRQELGQAFGRDQAVHAAVASGRIAETLEAATRRLAAYRQQEERDESE